MKKPLATQLAWLAGILEGEGCFSVNGRGARRGSRICLKMADRDVVSRAAKFMGGVVREDRSPSHLKRISSIHAKRLFIVGATGSRARRVMTWIQPHMGRRRTARIKQLLRGTWGYSR